MLNQVPRSGRAFQWVIRHAQVRFTLWIWVGFLIVFVPVLLADRERRELSLPSFFIASQASSSFVITPHVKVAEE
jgi:hypothetical protein